MYSSQLIQKLRMKSGHRAAFLHVPPGYSQGPREWPDGVQVFDESSVAGEPGQSLDFVHLFAGSVAELQERAPEALRVLKHDGVFWVSYPKQSSKVKTDINRDHGWDVIMTRGLRPVTQISIDEIWSALRFRPSDRVGR